MVRIEKSIIILLLILLLGFLLRAYKLEDFGIWGDEKCSIACAIGIPAYALMENVDNTKWNDYNLKHDSIFSSLDIWTFNNLGSVVEATKKGTGCIAYFISLYYWINVFGIYDFSVRFLSLFFGILVIILGYFVGKLFLESKKAALIFSFLLAINPLLIASSQYGKEHTMALFFTLLSSYFLFKIIKQKATLLIFILYSISASISILTHYYSFYIFLGHLAVFLYSIKNIKIYVKFILSCCLGLSIVLIWLYSSDFSEFKIAGILNERYVNIVSKWEKGNDAYYMPTNFYSISAGWVQVLLPMFGGYLQSFGIQLRFIIIFLALPILVFVFPISINRDKITVKIIILLLLLTLSAPTIATIMSLISGFVVFFQVDYGMYSLPYALLAFSYAVTIWLKNTSNSIVKKTGSVLLISQLIITISCYYPIYADTHRNRTYNPYIILSNKIINLYDLNDTIIYSNPEDALFTNFYLKDYNYIIQKIDTTIDKNFTYIKSLSDNSTDTIFDFKNNLLRY